MSEHQECEEEQTPRMWLMNTLLVIIVVMIIFMTVGAHFIREIYAERDAAVAKVIAYEAEIEAGIKWSDTIKAENAELEAKVAELETKVTELETTAKEVAEQPVAQEAQAAPAAKGKRKGLFVR